MRASENHPGLLLTVLLTGQLMANLDTTIVNVATPSIHTHLHASGAELELVVSAYILAYAVLLITGARLGDTHGHRRLFLTGLGVFTLASLACGLSPDALVLIVARVAQGVGAALMVPQVLSGIQLNFEGAARGKALGYYVLTLSAGAVVGQIFGGLLVNADILGTAWRPIFLINVPIGVLLFAAALRALPDDPGGEEKKLDLPGVATLAAALALLVIPLIVGRSEGWPTWSWACLALSVPAFALFTAVERRVARGAGYPLLNLHLLGRRHVSWSLIAIGLGTSAYYSALFVLALYLQVGLGKSPLYSGLALVPWVSAFGLAGQVRRRLHGRAGLVAAPLGYAILMGAFLGVAGLLSSGQRTGAPLMAVLGCAGFGIGLAFSSLITHLTGTVPPRYAPDLSGLVTTSSQLAGVAGVATYGTAYLALADSGARHAFVVVALALAGGAVVAVAAATLGVRPGADSAPL